MSRSTALRAFLVGAPLPFAALLTQHPMGTGDLFTEISEPAGVAGVGHDEASAAKLT